MTLVSTIVRTLDRPEPVGGAVESAPARTHDEVGGGIRDPPTGATRGVLDRYADDPNVRAI